MSTGRADLDALYPFLAPTRRSAAGALGETIRRKAEEGAELRVRFFETAAGDLLAAAATLADAFAAGGRLLCMGNGGSSCDASHLAVEFQHPVTTGRPALPALNLCVDTAMLTAVGNDVGMDRVFQRQVEAHGRPGDVLAGFSTSGNSTNLLAAFEEARRRGLRTLGFAGGDGGAMAASGFVDHCLVVPSDSIHRVQEVHVACYHVLWDLVHTLLADRRGRVGQETSP